jgi:aryl-alcohol dehydrogenase-like predicted oxidoreductase
MNLCQKIGLGTVQWGMPYGIANRTGQTSRAAIAEMLGIARAHGVTLLDTAHVYGDAEHELGQCGAVSAGFDVVTKTVPLKKRTITRDDVTRVGIAFESSLARLKTNHVHALLVHAAGDLLATGADHLWTALQDYRVRLCVTKIGVSVYRPDELRAIMQRYPIDVVQLPYNLYDDRFAREGCFAELKARGIEIHARSAFLQGVLLLPSEELPPYFAAIRDQQARLHGELRALGLTPLEAALGHCLREPAIDRVIVGCETRDQLMQILNAASSVNDSHALRGYAVQDTELLDPAHWPVPSAVQVGSA